MKCLLFTLVLISTSIVVAQPPGSDSLGDGATDQPQSGKPTTKKANAIPNPFESTERGSGDMMGGGMGGMGMGGMSDMGGDMVMTEYGMDMGMGMDMVTGGMGIGMTAEDAFRRGLQRAIVALGNAKSEPEKETLRQYVRQALESRYLRMIADRQREVEQLKQSVAKLESDLKRRESAKDRVIEVQMQSVQLAAEGLLQLGDLGSGEPGYETSGYGMGSSMGGLSPPQSRGRREPEMK